MERMEINPQPDTFLPDTLRPYIAGALPGAEKTIIAHFADNTNAANRLDDLCGIIRYVGSARGPAAQDSRDAAIMAAEVGFDIEEKTHAAEFDKSRIVDTYISTVQNLDTADDYFGSPHSTVELGELLADKLGATNDDALHYTA